MAPIETIAQGAVQVLSSSAWTGIGVVISSILALLALYKSGKPDTPLPDPLGLLKKSQSLERLTEFSIDIQQNLWYGVPSHFDINHA
jgi:hypothetical protein